MFTNNYLQLDVVPVFVSVESVGSFGCPVVRLFFIAILRFIVVLVLLSPLFVRQVFAWDSLLFDARIFVALYPIEFGSAC